MVLGMIFTACEQGGDIEENNEGTPSAPQIELAQQSVKAGFESAEYSVSLTANCSWEAESKNDWIILKTECGGKEESELRFIIKLNEDIEHREGAIVIQDKTKSMSVQLSVKQEAFIPELTLSSDKLQYAFEGGTKEVVITSNVAYEVVESCDWIICEKTQQGIKIIVDNSDILESRTAEVVIECAKYNILKIITITQGAFEPTLIVESISPLEFDYRGGTRLIAITSNFDYIVNCDAQWISWEQNAGGIEMSITQNTLSETREATLSISGDYTNIQNVNIIIIQTPINLTDNIIEYTDAYGGVINPFNPSAFNANIVSNSYIDGKGVIVFDAPITSIGEQAFQNSLLTSITLPNSIMSIEKAAFKGCTSLTNVYFSNSINHIGEEAFEGCDKLMNISLPNNLVTIGINAFKNCYKLARAIIPNSVTTIGNSAFSGCKSIGNLTIGNKVLTIGGNAFQNCSILKRIIIPDSVISIGAYAFSGCLNLVSTTIGKGVTTIGGDAFYNCTGELIINSKIVETDYANYNYPTWSHEGWLYGAKFSKIIIGNNIKRIGKRAFFNCQNLASVIIDNGVSQIGDEAFEGCTNLESVNIPNDAVSIGYDAFSNCQSLASINIPMNIQQIGNNAFYSCTSLTRVDITNLSVWCKISFANMYANPLLYAKKLYINGDILTTVSIPSDITVINSNTFRNCTTITSLTIPDGVTKIGMAAFYGCSNLVEIYCKSTNPPAIYYSKYGEQSLPLNVGMRIYVSRDSYNSYMQYSSPNTGSTTVVDNWYYYKSYIEISDF